MCVRLVLECLQLLNSFDTFLYRPFQFTYLPIYILQVTYSQVTVDSQVYSS